MREKKKKRYAGIFWQQPPLFFVFGINDKFIPNVTALDKENTAGYNKLNNTQKQIKKISSVIGENDRVYYICQYDGEDLSGAELFNASALYYMEPQIRQLPERAVEIYRGRLQYPSGRV